MCVFREGSAEGYIPKCKKYWMLEFGVILNVSQFFYNEHTWHYLHTFQNMDFLKKNPQCLLFLRVESGSYIYEFSAGIRKNLH